MLVDAGSGTIDVVEMAFEVGAGLVLRGKVVVRFEELLVFDDAGGVTVDRGIFVCANVPDGCGGAIRCSGGGKRRGFKVDRHISVEFSHGFLDAADHLVDARRKQRHGRGVRSGD